MKISSILIVVLTLGLAGVPALAQQIPPEADNGAEEHFTPGRRPDGPPSRERREEIGKKIEAIRIWRMTEALGLNADSAMKLASVLGPIGQKRREIMRAQAETMKTMRQELKHQKPDEATIKQLLDKLENDHRGMQELRDEETRRVKDILTIEQQARFLIFQQEFQREIRELIAAARGRSVERPEPGRGGAGRPPQFR